MSLSLVLNLRSVSRALGALRRAWLEDAPRRHAEATGLMLGHMMLNPRGVADRTLPLISEFLREHGPEGVDSIYLSAMSAAAAYNTPAFREGLAVGRAIVPARKGVAKPDFIIDLVDLGAEPMQRLAALFGAPRDRRHPALGLPGMEGIAARLDAARTGFHYPGARTGPFTEFISKLYPDGIRNAIYANLPSPSNTGMLPGFGPLMRGALGPFDEYRLPGASVSQEGRDNARAEKDAQTAAIVTAAAGGPEAQPGAHPLFGLLGAILEGLAASGAAAEAKSDVGEAMPPPWEPAGVCEDPDAKVKMPLPDEAGGGRPTLWELFQAYQRFNSRLDPLIRPMREDVGGDVTILRIPNPGWVDPLWEEVGFTIPEDELRRQLEFIQAKYFDSLVNPVRSDGSG
ncbi:hypothetical protein [Jannaschia ovalis]|uniref:Uncharacterized protein n=1 Tax=Jannaschia ovalis TaxID=3038773 RepID=A0ABY8LBM0_9RHOB|nr:hypothetical protein [Jannaschia sp. GRR-S6-38]WGH78681.1 hypothetical protein P8627_16985 [Jannaschia sp. GRR-S6-38]